MLKKQQNYNDSTRDETAEDLIQIAAIKEKQIDLLSNMLAQKEVDLKNLKFEKENEIKELNYKLKTI